MRHTFFLLGCALLLSGCGGADGPRLSAESALGQLAFNDPTLSASGRQSCASCHAAEAGHAAANSLAVQLGGADMLTEGLRASQSIRYLAANTAFHFDAEDIPTGGFFWDGRAKARHSMARMSWATPNELSPSSARHCNASSSRTRNSTPTRANTTKCCAAGQC
jgi:cytochrome c peroxidase